MPYTSLFINELTTIDFSYIDPTRALLGESWIVDIELLGELNDSGFIFDFALAKKTIKILLDRLIDHTLVLSKYDKRLKFSIKNDRISLSYKYGDAHIKMKAPLQSVFFLDTNKMSISYLESFIEKKIKKELPQNVLNINLRFRTEIIETPFYQYSHGLKKHDGNCQRIAHGHRSKIEIYINGKLSKKWMKFWAKKFNSIYIASREDIMNIDDTHINFSYKSTQGQFFLTLPILCCYIIDTESTIEEISRHIAKKIHEDQKNDEIIVHAFEGIKKGAIVRYEASSENVHLIPSI